jgi:hypothetical protein
MLHPSSSDEEKERKKLFTLMGWPQNKKADRESSEQNLEYDSPACRVYDLPIANNICLPGLIIYGGATEPSPQGLGFPYFASGLGTLARTKCAYLLSQAYSYLCNS